MTELPSNRKPLSPLEELANVCDALCGDELFLTETDTDQQRIEHAKSVVQAAIAGTLQAIPPARPSGNMPPGGVARGKTVTSAAELEPSSLRGGSSHERAQIPPQKALEYAQRLGLHPLTAAVLTGVNLGLDAAIVSTWALSFFVVSVPVGCAAGLFAYTIQRKWFGDSRSLAAVKALTLAFLTAIPVLPIFLFVPSGILGSISLARRKTRETTRETQLK